MYTKIYKAITEPDRNNLTWEEILHSEVKSLIKNYEVGRALAKSNSDLAEN